MKTITIKVPDVKELTRKAGEKLAKLIPPARVGQFGITSLRKISSKVLKKTGRSLTNLSKVVEPVKKPILTYPVMVRGTSLTQEIIRVLPKDAKAYLVMENNTEWPNQVSVYIDGKQVGNLPDNPERDGLSYAKMIRDKIRKGKFLDIVEWRKKGGGEVKFGIDLVLRVKR